MYKKNRDRESSKQHVSISYKFIEKITGLFSWKKFQWQFGHFYSKTDPIITGTKLYFYLITLRTKTEIYHSVGIKIVLLDKKISKKIMGQKISIIW